MARTGPFVFGANSQREMATVHHDLQIVSQHAIEVYDFSVTQGRRTIEEQLRNIRRGVSKTIDSRHIPRDEDGRYAPEKPAWAVDLTPYAPGVNPWPQTGESRNVQEKKKARFYYLQGVIRQAAHDEGIDIRGGHDWDMDDDLFDQKFDDLGHVELVIDPWPRLKLSDELLAAANEALAAYPGGALPPYRNP